jgi:hypothetical protein
MGLTSQMLTPIRNQAIISIQFHENDAYMWLPKSKGFVVGRIIVFTINFFAHFHRRALRNLQSRKEQCSYYNTETSSSTSDDSVALHHHQTVAKFSWLHRRT